MKLNVKNPIESMQIDRKLLTKALMARPQSLSTFLPYEEYDQVNHIFALKDGTLGKIFEVELLEHESKGEGKIIEAVNGTKNWFSLPENCVLQILFDQSQVARHDPIWRKLWSSYKYPHPVSEELFLKRIGELQENCSGNSKITTYKRRCFVSIRYYPERMAKIKFSDLVGVEFDQLDKETEQYLRNARAFSKMMKEFQGKSHLKLSDVDVHDFLDLSRRIFNPKEYYKREFSKFDPRHSISDQIIFSPPKVDFESVEREGLRSRVITMKMSPRYSYPGSVAEFLKLSFPFQISMNVSFPSKTKTNGYFSMKEFFLEKSQGAGPRRQLQDLRSVQEDLSKGDRCLFLTYNIVVQAESEEELDSRTRQIVNVFHDDLEAEVIVERDIGSGLFLCTLPLNYSKETDFSAQRYIRILKRDIVNFVPVFDSFRGQSEGHQLFTSREGNLTQIQLFSPSSRNHLVMIGNKDNRFAYDFLQSIKKSDPEPMVFVIGKGLDCQVLSDLFEGNSVDFDINEEMPFSPFRGQFDDDKVTFLKNLILCAIKLESPNMDVTSEHTSAVSAAVKNAYLKKREESGLIYENGELVKTDGDEISPISMDEVVAALAELPGKEDFKGTEIEVRELIKKLKPFYGDGDFARYFRGGDSANGNSDCLFYSYDMSGLDTDKKAQTLMTMAVLEDIRRKISSPDNKNKRNGFIFLPDVSLIGQGNEVVEQFVREAGEAFEKLGVWFIGASSRPEAFFETETGRAVQRLGNNFLFFPMGLDDIEYLGKQTRLMDKNNSQIAQSLRSSEEHTDVLLVGRQNENTGVFSFFQSSYDKALTPEPSLLAATREEVRKIGNQKWKALEKVCS